MSQRREGDGEEVGGGRTGDAGGVDEGEGRGQWCRRGGNMARNKQNPN